MVGAKCSPYRDFPTSTLSHLKNSEHQLYGRMAATLADNGFSFVQPVCQNCQTSTTPLWRRDEVGSVLCNACGLFLKLHGRPRPISLKTDVIKSRNRVKSTPHGQRKKVSRRSNAFLWNTLTDKATPSLHSNLQHPDQRQKLPLMEATYSGGARIRLHLARPTGHIHPYRGPILQVYIKTRISLPNTCSME